MARVLKGLTLVWKWPPYVLTAPRLPTVFLDTSNAAAAGTATKPETYYRKSLPSPRTLETKTQA